MRNNLSKLIILGGLLFFVASAAAQELNIRIPLPPIPKIVIPVPPPPKVRPQLPEARVETPPAIKGRHRYDYYPNAQVYFDPARQLYFFMEANRWISRPTLPPHIKVRIGPSVVVGLDSERPYEFDDEVRRYYPHREGVRRVGGYREGFDDGYQQGHGEGYSSGYTDGYNAAYKASFEQGYQSGYKACDQDYQGADRPGRGRGRERR